MANEFVARKGLISLANSQITGSLHTSGPVTASAYKGITLNGIDDVNTSGVQHQWGIIYNTASSQWEAADVGATGTVSDGQSLGTGVDVYKTKVGGTLQFRSILTGSNVVSVAQGADELTINFDGTEITQLGTVTVGDITGILPSGTVSSSAQVSYTGLSNIPAGIVSSSNQVVSLLPEGTVSSSAQVDYTGLSNIPSGIISSSTQQVVSSYTNATDNRVVTSTGAGGINGEANLTFDGATLDVTGDLTVSNKITAQEIWTQYITSSVGYLSGSTRFGSHPAASTTHEFTGSMLITGSTPTVNGTAVSLDGHTHAYGDLTAIPSGIVSSSGQVDYTGLSNIPSGIVSSSVQFDSLTAPFTGSFTGSFTGDGSGLSGVAGEVNFLQTTGSNLDVDIGTEVVATVNTGSYDAAWFDYVVKKAGGAHLRAGTVTAVWDAAEAANGVEFTDVSTLDIGDTSGVSFEMDLLDSNARLKATVTTDNWTVKAIVRAI